MSRSMNISRAALAAVGAAALFAGEPAVRLSIPDAQAVQRALAGGAFGAAWREPAVVAWRTAAQAEASPAWAALAAAAVQARVELTIGEPFGGHALIGLTAAALAPAAGVPPETAGIRTRRADAWVIGSSAGGELREPEMPERIDAVGDPVVAHAQIGLAPWLQLLPPERLVAAQRLLAALGLGRGRLAIQSGTAGFSERSFWPGAKLPLRPADPAVLAGLPDMPLLLVVAGLDGHAASAVASTVLDADPLMAPAVAEAFGVTSADLAAACDGTVVFAVLPGQPLPTWMLSLPRSAALDALLAARVAAQAPESSADVLAAIDQQPVAIIAPGLGTAMVQRSATRLIIGGTAGVVAAMAGDGLAPFPTERLWPELPADSVAMAYADLAAVARWCAPFAPEQARAAVAAAAGHLPAAGMALTNDKDGVVLSGRNVCGLLLPALALLPTAGPGLAESYERSCHAAAKAVIVRLDERARSFAAATSGHWPRDLDDLRAWAKDLPVDSIGQAGRPDIAKPFCYVQPRVSPPADQPVIVQDPAANRGAGSLVGFAGGEVRFIPGDLYWREARRLSELPDTRADGVDAAQWATMPRTF